MNEHLRQSPADIKQEPVQPAVQPVDIDRLINLVQPLIPVLRDYITGKQKDTETDQMSIEADFQLRMQEMKNLRDEQSEARSERKELRRMAILALILLGIVLVIVVLKDQTATALEIIKLLAGVLGPAFGAYWYGKAKKDIPVLPKEKRADNDDES